MNWHEMQEYRLSAVEISVAEFTGNDWLNYVGRARGSWHNPIAEMYYRAQARLAGWNGTLRGES